MSKQKTRSKAKRVAPQGGGGNATAAGVKFQANFGALMCAYLLGERSPDTRLPGQKVLSVRFETETPVDDVLIETDSGRVFVQAKTNVSLSTDPASVLGKVVDQFVRQWLACRHGDGKLGWDRPLRPDKDRLVLAVGPAASGSLSVGLARALAAKQAASSAPLSKSQAAVLKSFDYLLARALQSLTGKPATAVEVKAIRSLVTILPLDLDGADRATAVEMLSNVLEQPSAGRVVFSKIADQCLEMMKQRTGCDLGSLRQALTGMGVRLLAPPTYRADVDALKKYSELVQSQLSDYESIQIERVPIKVSRDCTRIVIEAVRSGSSLLLVGEPGAGKSAIVNASAKTLADENFDVVQLAVDRLPVKTTSDLSRELGLTHPLRDVLLNWPGDRPAILFVDALDATRSGENEAVFRTLISEVLSFPTRKWHVVASIRTFDLRLGEQFKALFKGEPPGPEFADKTFSNVAHIHVPKWTPAELEKLLNQAPKLAKALEAGGERLRELATVPFNTRLLADLISDGVNPDDFGKVQSQVQLLALYWNNRVAKHGTAAELCVRAAVGQMVASRALRANKLDVAKPDAKTFDKLLSENVMVLSQQDQYVSFRHHILFDYAASRVYLQPDDDEAIARLFAHDSGLGLTLAPALEFALQKLWNEPGVDHGHFWQAIVRLAGDGGCDPIARSVAARIGADVPRVSDDAVGLLVGLTQTGEPKERTVKALGQVVGSLIVQVDDKKNPSLDPWCRLAEKAADHVEEVAWPLRALLYALYEKIESDVQRGQLGSAARKLLTHSLSSPKYAQLTGPAIGFVAETIASEPAASKKLLRRLFEPQHFAEYADQEIPWLTRKLKPIAAVDPEFVSEIFAEVFGKDISDQRTTVMSNSRILPLTSNRRQDYRMTRWALKEFFPKFLKEHPREGVVALVNALNGFMAVEHTGLEKYEVVEIPTPRGSAQFRTDHSHIWAWNVHDEHSNDALGVAKAYVARLKEADAADARAIVEVVIERNDLAVLWARTFMAAAGRPDVLGDLLWPIATHEVILTSLDSRKDAIDFIAARYPLEASAARAEFERRAIEWTHANFERPDKARERFLSNLFATIGEHNLVSSEAKALCPKEEISGAPIERNTRPFTIETGFGSPDKWWWLAKEGVDLKDPGVKRFLMANDALRDEVGLGDREKEIADIPRAISMIAGLLDMADMELGTLPNVATNYAYGTAAQAVAKLSRVPAERLREKAKSLPATVALVRRLAQQPIEPADEAAEAQFESHAGWGSPFALVDTSEAVMHLCGFDTAIVEQLRPTMERLLQAPHPAVRLQISERLTSLWNTGRPLMWELAERVARTEKNRGVLKFFANYFLNRTVHADPPRIEELALLIQSREFNRADEATRSLSEEIGNIIALLWISHGREVSRQMLEKWIADPHAHEAELGRAIFISRDALVLRYRSTEACDEGITRRAQDFCAWTVNAMAEGLERYLDMVRQTEPTEAERERGARYAKLLGEMTNQIYFASGAFRSGEREETLLDSVEAKRAFLADMSTVLARVAEVGTPDTIYHLIELLGYLTPANPALVFDLVARALLGGGKRHNFQFESLGADRFVEIVGLFLADHRELFSADERRRKDLVSCLEVFTEAGWPAARRLLYRLPELLR